MSEAKHTPGPWINGPTEKTKLGVFAKDYGAVICYTAVNVAQRADPANLANARLIAAAPDLLAACKMVSEMAVNWAPLSPGDIAEVKAAIAKAEGRE